MKVIKENGVSFGVECDELDVERFNRLWPGSKLVGLRGVYFGFTDLGDLVDVDTANGGHTRWDGPELLALSGDALEFFLSMLTS